MGLIGLLFNLGKIMAYNPTPFPKGTIMLFAQTTAPVGWTKSTTHNNKALRVVSGSAGSGGTVDFTTAFASKSVSGSVNNTTLTLSQIPNVTGSITNHGSEGGSSLWNPTGVFNTSSIYSAGYRAPNGTTGGANSISVINFSLGGGSQAHNHGFTGTSIDLAVQYVDVILATKD